MPGAALRACVAMLLLFAFSLMALPAQMHRHAAADTQTYHQAANASAQETDCTTADHKAFETAHCALCEFAAANIAPAVALELPPVVPHVTAAPAALLPLRTQPFLPYRFADRSASRAPPTAHV